MANIFDDMRQAVSDAEHALMAADAISDNMAMLLIGRLKQVTPWRLAKLKKELKDFNIHTGKWSK